MGDQHTQTPQQDTRELSGAEKIGPQAKTPGALYDSRHRMSVAGLGSPAAPPLTRDNLLFLQRTVGNRAVTQLLRGAAKLSAPPGAGVREAAGAGTHGAGAGRIVQRKCACGADAGVHGQCAGCRAVRQTVQRQAEGPSEQSLPPSVNHVMQTGGGEALPRPARERMEGLLGADLAGVRTHTDSQAALAANDINARAFTVGPDIYFAAGQFRPDTEQGQHLLAHELTHTVQQADGRSAFNASSPISRPDDPLEREADEVASAVGRTSSTEAGRASPAAESPERPARVAARPAMARLVQRSWYDPFVEGAEWVGGKVAAGAGAVWDGTKWVGGKIAGETRRIAGAAVDCFGSVTGAVGDLIFGSGGRPDSLEGLMGVPRPEGQDPPGLLDTIIGVAQHPCVQMIPGYTLLSSAIGRLSGVKDFLAGAWRVMQDPSVLLDAIRNALSGLMAEIPGKAEAVLQQLVGVGGAAKDHLEGVWRHLEPKLHYLADNWWEVLKQTGEDLIWPWPGVGKDLEEIWGHLKGATGDIWDLDFGGAADHLLAVWRGFNSIAGRLYGWFFIASVLVGAIIGAFFGGAGAIPGAAAGAAFALKVGQVMLLSTVGAETASIAKAVFDLATADQTEDEEEEDYEQIANSGLTLGIIGVLFLLGVVAARFAQGIISLTRSLWRRGVRLLRTRALGSRSIVVDENLLIALDKRAAGQSLQAGERRMLEFLDNNPDAVLTVTEELYNKRLAAGQDVSRLRVMRGGAGRGGPEYNEVIRELETNRVGAGKGAEDRRMIADTLFAETRPGVTPTFVTHDAGIYKRLAAMAGHDLRTLGRTVPEAFPNGFEVTVRGRRLRVIPLPSR